MEAQEGPNPVIGKKRSEMLIIRPRHLASTIRPLPHLRAMCLKSVVFLALLAVTNAADILTFKITDFQGSSVDLTGGSPSPLTPVQSFTTSTNQSQNASQRFVPLLYTYQRPQWLFIYAMNGDENEYRVINAAGRSILSYTSDNYETPGPAIHAQIVGNQNVSTFWDIMPVSKGSVESYFIEKRTGLAMTAWPAGKGSSRSSPVSNSVPGVQFI
ncbi:hypothetical protein B0H17DRAFT_1139814 [Mycena rosella]|uniref:Uncharacterized protein n=1 Tax=Mycena rosella TaxID=1033263 RepID=A0AAD7D3R6_MYCRO|nr:hypothetical protein B0H17DRAFT_1139814 [Mycena rosella]